MPSCEKKFLDELAKLFCSYAIDEVRVEERDGEKFIVIHSNGTYLAFKYYNEGIYNDLYLQISQYGTPWGVVEE